MAVQKVTSDQVIDVNTQLPLTNILYTANTTANMANTIANAAYAQANAAYNAANNAGTSIPYNCPPAAQMVGYKNLVFGPNLAYGNTLGPGQNNWTLDNFYGEGNVANQVIVCANGCLYMSGIYLGGNGNGSGGIISSAKQIPGTANGLNWQGYAFGNGAYFEAELLFTGQGTGPYAAGGPAFWALDVEHTSQYAPSTVTWSTANNAAWNSSATYSSGCCVSYGGNYYFYMNPSTNQNPSTNNYANLGNNVANCAWMISTTYNDFFEIDFMEYDVGNQYSYQNGIGHWYSQNQSTGTPWNATGGSTGSITPLISGTNFATYHKYGCLWVPATATTRGYLKFYFDDAPVGGTYYWDQYNANNPPPPIVGSTAMARMDTRHMFLQLGTGNNQPMTVRSVSVWQGANGTVLLN